MKFSSVFSLSLLGFALAAPTPTEEENRAVAHIAKRATVTDAANVVRLILLLQHVNHS